MKENTIAMKVSFFQYTKIGSHENNAINRIVFRIYHLAYMLYVIISILKLFGLCIRKYDVNRHTLNWKMNTSIVIYTYSC